MILNGPHFNRDVAFSLNGLTRSGDSVVKDSHRFNEQLDRDTQDIKKTQKLVLVDAISFVWVRYPRSAKL